jgi:hypothetical protein
MLLPQQNVITNLQPVVSASLVYANSNNNSNNNTPAATSRTQSRAQSRVSNTPRDVASLETPNLNLQENVPSNNNIVVEIQNIEVSDTIINNSTNIENAINNGQNSILNPVSSNEIPVDQHSIISVDLDNIVVHENAENNDDAFLM